ncbi:hypothetical protein WICPIJ_000957 [Wickerhamomyces pijperi]|uniref:Uncharacterized protein n=1 Tax=Wickerhamomyces pijperi TaxID=599730 RepID=A0A9P8QEX3_WICPI|nr:hypothetical protein WICPIJ_000957 [Wickerhamomyces pijperi]
MNSLCFLLLFILTLSLTSHAIPNSPYHLAPTDQRPEPQILIKSSTPGKDIWSRYEGVSSNVVYKLRKRTVLSEDLGFDDDDSIKLALFTGEADAVIETSQGSNMDKALKYMPETIQEEHQLQQHLEQVYDHERGTYVSNHVVSKAHAANKGNFKKFKGKVSKLNGNVDQKVIMLKAESLPKDTTVPIKNESEPKTNLSLSTSPDLDFDANIVDADYDSSSWPFVPTPSSDLQNTSRMPEPSSDATDPKLKPFEFPFSDLSSFQALQFKSMFQRLTNKTWLNNPNYVSSIREGTGLREIIHKLDADIPRFFHECSNEKILKLTQSKLVQFQNMSQLDSLDFHNNNNIVPSSLILNHTWVWFQNQWQNNGKPIEIQNNNKNLVNIESILNPSDYKHIKTLTHKFIYTFQINGTDVYKYGYSLVLSYNEFIRRLTLELRPLSALQEDITDDVLFKILLFCESNVNSVLKYDNKHELTRSIRV